MPSPVWRQNLKPVFTERVSAPRWMHYQLMGLSVASVTSSPFSSTLTVIQWNVHWMMRIIHKSPFARLMPVLLLARDVWLSCRKRSSFKMGMVKILPGRKESWLESPLQIQQMNTPSCGFIRQGKTGKKEEQKGKTGKGKKGRKHQARPQITGLLESQTCPPPPGCTVYELY